MTIPVYGLLIAIAGGLLGGCAVATMTPETHARMLDEDAAKLSGVPTCCREWRDVDFARTLGTEGSDVVFGAQSQVRDFGSYEAAVAGFRIPDAISNDEIEVFSYSDARHGAMRFDNRLFVRPDLVFLDRQFDTVQVARDIPMCFGSRDGGGGVWYRAPIPANAAYVVLSPSTHVPMQEVDTRILGTIPPGIQAIADARGKTYLSAVAMGYTGLVSVRAVESNSRPLGRCVEASSH
jgi:hypothetical protein